MNRLTEKDARGNWSLRGVPWENLREGAIINRETSEKLYGALCKLMRYEDTEMSPNQIQELAEKQRSSGRYTLAWNER